MMMWKSFLFQKKGWQPIICRCSRQSPLGWGTFYPAECLWMYEKWDPVWFQEYQPSINLLELYALLARVVTWVSHLSNKTVILRSDNTLTVHALLNKTSNSHQMLTLLRYFMLFCMVHNIHIKALHISGKKNILCDLLSCIKLQEFQWVKPGNTASSPSQPATLISAISEFM